MKNNMVLVAMILFVSVGCSKSQVIEPEVVNSTITPTATAILPAKTNTFITTPTLFSTDIIPTETTTFTPEPSKTPTKTKNITDLPLLKQRYPLSCEMASAEICVLWYNQGNYNKILIPVGYKTFEDYFIEKAGIADNPVEGFYGNINGEPGINCGNLDIYGYGVYPLPIIKGYQSLGVLAEAIVLKDIDDLSIRKFKQCLIDSYNNNQVLQLWGRNPNENLQWRKNIRTGEIYPMGFLEHCVAGRVTGFDKDLNPILEISDPSPNIENRIQVISFADLILWMKNMGWLMAIKVG